MVKKAIAILLAFSAVISSAVGVMASESDMVGKYIVLGKYNNVPVIYKIWGVRDVDDDGVQELFIAPEKSLFTMAWESTNIGGDGGDWSTSTLRSYLNDDETGFLSGFTASERALIAPVTQKTLYISGSGKEGGTTKFNNNNTFLSNQGSSYTFAPYKTAYEALTDYKYDNCMYKYSTDKVFIPSLKDIYDYGIFGTEYMYGNADTASSSATHDSVWIRDHHSNNNTNTYAWRWYQDGRVLYDSAAIPHLVRPAFYIEPDFMMHGAGTISDPYRMSVSYSVMQNGKEVKTVFEAGPVDIGGTIYPDADCTLRVSVIEVSETSETMVDYAEQALMGNVENPINILLNSTGDKCYATISVCDALGTPVGSSFTVGASSVLKSSDRTVSELSVNAAVSGKIITVQGNVPESLGNIANVKIAKKSDFASVAYINQILIPVSRSFDLAVSVESLFGSETVIDGWYNVSIITPGGTASTDAGIAGAAMYSSIIDMFNGGQWNNIFKIFTKDAEYLLEYYAVSGKGYYELEYADNSQVLANALEMMADNKPEGGWTSGNIIDDFNKYVSWAYFDVATALEKIQICADERYRTYLSTAEIVAESYYKTLAQDKETGLFAGITANNVSTLLGENVVLLYIEKAENSEQVREIVEAKATDIGITFATDYSSFTQKQLKALYDKLLGNKYSDFTSIKAAFESAYNKAKELTSALGASGGSAGGGGTSGSFSGGSSSSSSSFPIATVINTSIFKDTANITWGKEAIESLYKKGIISGYEDGTFSPDSMITREEIAKILAVAFGIEGSGTVHFDDVAENAWYSDYVTALAEKGIVSGVGGKSYGVGGLLTREDMAVMLYRIMGTEIYSADNSFSDFAKISSYAKDAVKGLSNMGIISGYDDNTFKPQATITRREAAIMVYRAMGGEK